MEQAEFERLIREGFESLPEAVREQIKNVALLLEDEPSIDVRKEEGLRDDETLLGRYVGVPRTARGEAYGVGVPLPDIITLYRIPIEEAAYEDMEHLSPLGFTEEMFRDRIRVVIADTIWHEFAHHFGMDEVEVRKREDGWGK